MYIYITKYGKIITNIYYSAFDAPAIIRQIIFLI